MERFISASAIHSESSRMRSALISCMVIAAIMAAVIPANAQISDSVAAFVDDRAITYSEFREQYRAVLKVTPGVTEDEVILAMINRVLLLREAKKLRIEVPSEDDVLREYIDMKVRSFIRISDRDVEEFYVLNLDQFSGRDLETVRDEIEKYLTEKEVNSRLRETLGELRRKAHIQIQLKEPPQP